jgi:hypothetical protein
MRCLALKGGEVAQHQGKESGAKIVPRKYSESGSKIYRN